MSISYSDNAHIILSLFSFLKGKYAYDITVLSCVFYASVNFLTNLLIF
jgi:hypothetical protein